MVNQVASRDVPALRRHTAAWLAVVALLLARGAVAVPCTGDCNGDAEVRIHEVIACVNNGLGLTELAFCAACDENGDGEVAINEIVSSVAAGIGARPGVECEEFDPVFQLTTERVTRANFPLALAFAPDGRLFFNEKSGTVAVYENGRTRDFAQVDTMTCGELGLLGLALDPDFERNRHVYVYYVEPIDPEEFVGRPIIARFTDVDGTGTDPTILVDDLPPTVGICNHVAGGLEFGPDGHLYVSIGDMQFWEPNQARDVGSPRGKILRLDKRDGSAPPDNPFVDEPGADPRVYAYGLRNTYNFTFHPHNGKLYAGENGRGNCDELNIIESGADYGHPEASIRGPDPPCFERPGQRPIYLYSIPTAEPEDDSSNVAPTGMTFVSGEVYPTLGDSLLACEFRTKFMRRLALAGEELNQVTDDSVILEDCTLAVTTDPNGVVYYSNGGEIRRIVPR